MLDYLVLYTSRTGNTKQLAKEIFAALPGTEKDICELEDAGSFQEAAVYFVGFWVNQGTCEMNVIDALGSMHGKSVALFGTCGMGGDSAYYKKIENNISVFLPEDNQYLGIYLCQGKMPMTVRNKYEGMMAAAKEKGAVERMIQNFDEALLHPNEKDFREAVEFAAAAVESVKGTLSKK